MGKEMRETLEEAGIKQHNLLIVHSYACQATEPKRLRDERKATVACRPLLWKSIGDAPFTTPVMGAGKWAMLSLMGKDKGLFNTRGFVNMKWELGTTMPHVLDEGVEEKDHEAEES